MTEYVYDALNRQTHEKWVNADGASVDRDIVSVYDDLGRLTSIGDGTTSYTYTYDALGRITQIVSTQPDLATSTTTYDYDDNSNLTELANTLLGTYTYEYDGLNRLTAVIYDDGTLTTGQRRIDYTYDDISQYDIVTYREGIDLATATTVATADYDFDAVGRLTALDYVQGTTALAGYDYTYDAVGNMLSMSSDNTNDGTSDYAYDGTNQLTSTDYDYQTQIEDESYTYDENGNRTADDTATLTYGDDNRLQSDGVFNYTYDDEGNLITRTRISSDPADDYLTEYEYDYRNKLISVIYKNNSDVVTQSLVFEYDVLGNRIKKEYDYDGAGAAAAIETYYLYNDNDVAYEVTEDANSNELASHVYLPRSRRPNSRRC